MASTSRSILISGTESNSDSDEDERPFIRRSSYRSHLSSQKKPKGILSNMSTPPAAADTSVSPNGTLASTTTGSTKMSAAQSLAPVESSRTSPMVISISDDDDDEELTTPRRNPQRLGRPGYLKDPLAPGAEELFELRYGISDWRAEKERERRRAGSRYWSAEEEDRAAERAQRRRQRGGMSRAQAMLMEVDGETDDEEDIFGDLAKKRLSAKLKVEDLEEAKRISGQDLRSSDTTDGKVVEKQSAMDMRDTLSVLDSKQTLPRIGSQGQHIKTRADAARRHTDTATTANQVHKQASKAQSNNHSTNQPKDSAAEQGKPAIGKITHQTTWPAAKAGDKSIPTSQRVTRLCSKLTAISNKRNLHKRNTARSNISKANDPTPAAATKSKTAPLAAAMKKSVVGQTGKADNSIPAATKTKTAPQAEAKGKSMISKTYSVRNPLAERVKRAVPKHTAPKQALAELLGKGKEKEQGDQEKLRIKDLTKRLEANEAQANRLEVQLGQAQRKMRKLESRLKAQKGAKT